MQPILVLAIAGIAVAALGSGFLGNVINLEDMVQQFGVGEATIETPLTQAYIDFQIDKINGQVLPPGGGEQIQVFKNVITFCIVQSGSQLASGSTIICKLTDENDNVVIEGKKVLSTTLATKVPTKVPIVFTGSGTPTNLVSNIHDLILVVQGPSALVTVP